MIKYNLKEANMTTLCNSIIGLFCLPNRDIQPVLFEEMEFYLTFVPNAIALVLGLRASSQRSLALRLGYIEIRPSRPEI
jgi:hypothetical protein